MSAAGVPDFENAAIHGVAVKTIRRWRHEYQQRGKPRGQLHTSQLCPRCEGSRLDEESYAELLGWYLGDGHISASRRGVFNLHVFNDVRYEALNLHVQDLMRRVKPHSRPHTRQLTGAVCITVGWKHWPCLFPQHGPGRKHLRPIVLEDWQVQIVGEHPGRLLRGLFHSDGCRITNWTVRPLRDGPKRYEYTRYMFSNESSDIMSICIAALDLLGIAWRMPRPNLLSVARRESVLTLDAHVGPKA